MASLTLLLPQILFVCLFVPSLARGWIVWLAACLSQMNGYEWLAGWFSQWLVGCLSVRSFVRWFTGMVVVVLVGVSHVFVFYS